MKATIKPAGSRALLFLCLFLTSCASLKSSRQRLRLDKSYCNQRPVLAYTKDQLPVPFHELRMDTLLTNRFSYPALNTANAIGILDLLIQYVNLIEDNQFSSEASKKTEAIYLLQKINQKINIASLEISGVASELDCEEKRADQFAYYLREKEDHVENKLVIGSLIVVAAGSILAELISKNEGNDNLASNITIGSSIIEASFGILMLTNKKKVEFSNSGNALADVYNKPAVSDYYPPSIWYYLTYENPEKDEKSLARLLVEKMEALWTN